MAMNIIEQRMNAVYAVCVHDLVPFDGPYQAVVTPVPQFGVAVPHQFRHEAQLAQPEGQIDFLKHRNTAVETVNVEDEEGDDDHLGKTGPDIAGNSGNSNVSDDDDLVPGGLNKVDDFDTLMLTEVEHQEAAIFADDFGELDIDEFDATNRMVGMHNDASDLDGMDIDTDGLGVDAGASEAEAGAMDLNEDDSVIMIVYGYGGNIQAVHGPQEIISGADLHPAQTRLINPGTEGLGDARFGSAQTLNRYLDSPIEAEVELGSVPVRIEGGVELGNTAVATGVQCFSSSGIQAGQGHGYEATPPPHPPNCCLGAPVASVPPTPPAPPPTPCRVTPHVPRVAKPGSTPGLTLEGSQSSDTSSGIADPEESLQSLPASADDDHPAAPNCEYEVPSQVMDFSVRQIPTLMLQYPTPHEASLDVARMDLSLLTSPVPRRTRRQRRMESPISPSPHPFHRMAGRGGSTAVTSSEMDDLAQLLEACTLADASDPAPSVSRQAVGEAHTNVPPPQTEFTGEDRMEEELPVNLAELAGSLMPSDWEGIAAFLDGGCHPL